MALLRRIVKHSHDAAQRFFVEGYSYRVSALAFTTLLAIVPFITVIFFFIALFPIFSRTMHVAEEYLLKNFIPPSTLTIQNYLGAFIQHSSKLPITSLFFLLITATLLINTIEETLNSVWKVKENRGFGFAILVYWSIIISAPIVVGVSVFSSSYVLSLLWVDGAASHLDINIFVAVLVPFFINTLLFSLLYIIVPNAYVTVKEGLVGGVITAILFEISRFVFTFYLEKFPSYELIYGALATIPIFLVWLYICWFIVLFGGLFAYEFGKDR